MLTNINRHMLEGFVNWCVENGFRPYVSVNVKEPGLVCSMASSFDPIMPLNLAANACGRLEYAPDNLIIETSFNRKRETVFVPYEAIVLFHTPDAEIVVPTLGDDATRFQLQFPALPMEGWVPRGDTVVKPKAPAPKEEPKAKVSHLRVVK